MGTVPLYQRSKLPPARAGIEKPSYELAQRVSRPANVIDKSGQIQFGQALAGFSGDIFEKLVRVRANNEHHEFLGLVSTAQQSFDTFVQTNPGASLEDLQKAKQQMLKDIDTASQYKKGQTQIAAEANKNFMLNNRRLIEEQADTTVGAIAMKHASDKFQIQEDIYIKTFQKDKLADLLNGAAESGLLDSEVAKVRLKAGELLIATGLKKQQEEAIELQIKNELVSIIGDDLNKQKGYDLLDSLVKDKVIDIDQNKKIGDWMDSFVEGRKKAEEQSIHQAYADFSEKITTGNLSFDEIDLSKLPNDDKELWQSYLKGSFVEPAKENNPKFFRNVVGGILDVATLEMSPKEAYDTVLNAYYVKHSITKDQLDWSLNKIKKPYPKHLVADIRQALNTVDTEGFDMLGYNSKARTKANEDLLRWVDKLIEQDKVPLFDFGKKLDAMATYYRWGREDYLRDIGDVIERGGKQWEIVGYDSNDSNGEPLVEEYNPKNPFIPSVE